MSGDPTISVLGGLEAVLAALRLIIEALDVHPDETVVRVSAVGKDTRELASISLTDLLARADAAIAAAKEQRVASRLLGHSLLPWSPSTVMDDPLVLYDALGTKIVVATCDHVPTDEAEANAALVRRACNGYPQLVATLQTAAQALRSYQYFSSAPDVAREVAEACERVLAEQGATP